MAHEVTQGIVKWFNDAKGFGFISVGGSFEVFAHYSDILGEGRRTLEQHQVVEFRLDQNAKGPRAREIRAL